MNPMRHLSVLAAAALFAGAGATACAGDVSMAGGSVHFSTPANWVGIMQMQGDPEVQVFQVPDPSPTGSTSLARVTVTVKQEPDLAGFNAYRSAADAKAHQLAGYSPLPPPGDDPGGSAYGASENGAPFHYVEYYWFKDGHAIQLRCVRPVQSLAGASWIAAFDRGCDAIATQLQ